MSPQAFTAGITILEDIYPKSLSEAASSIYAEVCGHLSDDVWLEAVRRVCGRNRFFPVPAEILAAAQEVAARAHGVQSPDEAWESVLGVAKSWGEGKSIRALLEPSVFDAVQAIGGIRDVAVADDGYELHQIRSQFVTTYTRGFDRITDVAVTLPLETAADRPMLANGRRG